MITTVILTVLLHVTWLVLRIEFVTLLCVAYGWWLVMLVLAEIEFNRTGPGGMA